MSKTLQEQLQEKLDAGLKLKPSGTTEKPSNPTPASDATSARRSAQERRGDQPARPGHGGNPGSNPPRQGDGQNQNRHKPKGGQHGGQNRDNRQRQGGPKLHGGHGKDNQRSGGGGGHPGGGASTPPAFCLDISAPYNFVPLANFVLHPDWQDSVSHDLPYKDGLCGELVFTLEADTPILVGAEKQGNTVNFFTHPDGKPAIPGSTLRGMVRNVLEIATFARIGTHVDNQWLAIRDLTGAASEAYSKEMTTSSKHKHYEPLSHSGWLEFDTSRQCWSILPCDYARVEASVIHARFPMAWTKDLLRCRLLDKQKQDAGKTPPLALRLNAAEETEFGTLKQKVRVTAFRKYSDLLPLNGNTLAVSFMHDPAKHHPHSRGNELYYSKVTNFSGSMPGFLVFTGQPSHGKHMEFIFHSNKSQSIAVSDEVMRAFLATHEESEEWKHLHSLKSHFPHGLPVFYLENFGGIQAVGLAQMFKLKYQHSLHQTIENTSKEHVETNGKLDFVETLFGRVDPDGQSAALKGRVSFSDARLTTQAEYGNETTILSSPKPTYYPNYIKQENTDSSGHLPTRGNSKNVCGVEANAQYSTLMDPKPEIRGWKRYPVRPLDQVKPAELNAGNAGNSKIRVQLKTLNASPDKPAKFTGKLRFHNLKPAELGALVWALNWGGNDKLRHSVGMGKPFGYGSVRCVIDADKSSLLHNQLGTKPKSVDDYMKQFCDWVETAYTQAGGTGTWSTSEQLKQLLGMANPANAKGRTLAHMQLSNTSKDNAFLQAKVAGRVLQPYIK